MLMENRLIFFLLLLFSPGLRAQTTITFQHNSLRSVDCNTYQEVLFVDPGASGPNQVWDFSLLAPTGKNQCSSIMAATLPKMTGVGPYNLLLGENGYEYMMNSAENRLEELGYVNNEQKLTLVYTDPVVKMKYPFAFGNLYTDHFIAEAITNGTSKIDFAGDITVSADGSGTLVLPDRVINGALRVKSVKSGKQINLCGTSDVNIVKYSWYATGYRYPLLNLSVVEVCTNGGVPVITRSANYNVLQLYEKSAVVGSVAKAATAPVAKSDVKVVISPNPFTDQLVYSYVLTDPLHVTIDLYDMAGKIYGRLLTDQLQDVGLHNGELVAARYELTPGVYFMRFTFDKQIAIFRVVKY